MVSMTILFWFSTAVVIYAYFGYPFVLLVLTKIRSRHTMPEESADFQPTVSIIIPAYNEGKVLEKKIQNTLRLEYPASKREILIISDGSTDNTKRITEQFSPDVVFRELAKRSGKAAALNLGLQCAKNEILVFSDASIMLKANALQNLVVKFNNPRVGCISGQDQIEGNSGEGLYGKYELFLRELESRFYSIVGASGSFYAQRRKLCQPFEEGLAPDFLSVLNCVEQGFIAVTEPSAIGTMSAVKETEDEFGRKVRTLVRGMTALFKKPELLNPFKYPLFSFTLLSHKIARWLVPCFLLLTFISTLFLTEKYVYFLLFILQIIFYSMAVISAFNLKYFQNVLLLKIPHYFLLVNLAILVAWWKYLCGVRQEIWTPSQR